MDIMQRNNVQVLGGSGPVLLFAHGFGCNQSMWSRVIPAFQQHYRIVLFDYVGCGGSDLSAFDPRRYASLAGYTQDLLEVCDALQLSREVIFVGHSVSASIGLLASIQRPELFERLILLGPSPCFVNDPPDYIGGFERADLDGLFELMEQNYMGWANYLAPVAAGEPAGGAVAGELASSFCSTDPVMARAFARAAFLADNRADLPKVTRPCLILQHARDALAPLSVGDFLHAQLRDSQLEVLDADGHCAHMSDPPRVVAAIERYLAEATVA